jgi:hypothetical protein
MLACLLQPVKDLVTASLNATGITAATATVTEMKPDDPCLTQAKDTDACDQRCDGQPKDSAAYPVCVGKATTGESGLRSNIRPSNCSVLFSRSTTTIYHCFFGQLINAPYSNNVGIRVS